MGGGGVDLPEHPRYGCGGARFAGPTRGELFSLRIMSRSSQVVALCLLVAGCASQQVRAPTTLPFHVAVIPVQVRSIPQTSIEEGKETDLSLGFDSNRLSQILTETLDGRCFSRAIRSFSTTGPRAAGS